MSDRIDELVTMLQQDSPFRDGTPLYKSWRNERDNAAVELATIAREAEARVAEWIDRCYQSEERALKAEAMCKWLAEEVAMGRHDTVDNVLAAARKAVANER